VSVFSYPLLKFSTTGSIPLHIACMSNSLECAKLLIEHGAKVNEVDTQYFTPLHHAAHKGNPELVTLLIQKGSDPCI
jgi:ankyrin repeat protein